MTQKILNTDNFSLKFIERDNINLEPLLELQKGKLFCGIIKHFINECIQTFGTKIFSIKKSYPRTITNILSSWMFSLYTEYDYSSDYFFPTNYKNVKLLQDILNDFCKFNPSIVNKEVLIEKVLSNLVSYYEHQLKQLDQYSKSDIYNNNKKCYKITRMVYKQNRSSSNILFYKFNIQIKYSIKDKRLKNILDNILLPITIYDKLKSQYKGPEDKLDEYLWAIVFRYQLLGSNNHQLAVLPNIMNQMNNDYNLSFECFASSINSTFHNFCSIYYDLEKHFGSVGSFFSIVPLKGTFGFNPPYQTDIITKGILIILEYLNTNKDLTFIITIPIWDEKGKEIMKEKFNNELEYQNIDYGDFEIVNIVRESKYFKTLRMIPKEDFTYIDHNFLLYKNKTIQNTYVIILSNTNIDIKLLDTYNFTK